MKQITTSSKYVFTLILFCAVTAPAIFTGLDPHHDGLVMNIINLTKEALRNGTPLPFNQYGIFWSLSMSMMTLPFEASYTLVIIRILTLIIYLVTLVLTILLAKDLGFARIWPTVFAFIILTQPWSSGLTSTFLPWPSALSSLLLVLVSLLVIRSSNKTAAGFHDLVPGFVIGLMLLTRIQIGILALLATILLILMLRRYQSIVYVLTGVFLSVGSTALYLYSEGWLDEVFFDNVVFPFSYLQDRYQVNPRPVGTFLIVVCTLSGILLNKQLIKRVSTPIGQKISQTSILALLASLVGAGVYALFTDHFSEYLIFFRRLIIGFFIGVILYLLFKISLPNLSLSSFTSKRMALVGLLFFSIVGLFNIYPQFDQTHFWWSIFPGVILVACVISEELATFAKRQKKLVLASFILIGILFVGIPGYQSLVSPKSDYPKDLAYGITLSSSALNSVNKTQDFFHENIKEGSVVLNLCHNSDVFFDRQLAIPASRFFIYWPPFISDLKIRHDVLASVPEAIITCNQNHILAAATDTQINQKELVDMLGFTYETPSASTSIGDTTWLIFGTA
jgi:hypothetical protein